VSDDYFSFMDKRTGPKPSHQRPGPTRGKVKNMGLNDRVTEIDRPAKDSILVEESTASDSMILRIIGKFRGQ
jgi:hypothetical protein